METKIALLGIIVNDRTYARQLNQLLSEYGDYIIGRMGIPHQKNDISLISIGMEAPQDVISTLSGKIGMLPGITSKVIYAKTQPANEKK